MELIITKEIGNLLKEVKFTYNTSDVDRDANGDVKHTSSGNVVYKKGNFYMRNLLTVSDSEIAYFDGQRLEATNAGNFLSLRRGGTMYTGNNRDEAWTPEKRVKVIRWGRLLQPIAVAIEQYIEAYISKNGGATAARNAELMVEAIKKHMSLGELELKFVAPSEVYKTKFGDSLGSCMSFENNTKYSNREYVDVYDDIDGCKGVIGYKGDTPVARTLIWNDKYFDKIYGVGHNEKLALEGSLKNNDYEYIQDVDEVVFVKLDNMLYDEEYPYFDSMCYQTYTEDNEYYLTNRCLDGNKHEVKYMPDGEEYDVTYYTSEDVQFIGHEILTCYVSGDEIDEYEDEHVLVTVNGEEVHVLTEYASMCDGCGDWFLKEDLITTTDEHLTCDSCIVHLYDGTTTTDENSVTLDYGDYAGQAGDVTNCTYHDEYGWMLDEDFERLEAEEVELEEEEA